MKRRVGGVEVRCSPRPPPSCSVEGSGARVHVLGVAPSVVPCGLGPTPRPERPQAARPARRRAEGPPARAEGALESVEKVLTQGALGLLLTPLPVLDRQGGLGQQSVA